MNALSYFAALAVSFLGGFVGLALVCIAPEEKKPGEKYFYLLHELILAIIACFLLYFSFNWLSGLLSLLLAAAMFALRRRKSEFYIVPIILAIIFYVSSEKINLFLITSILIFVYNMATGSLIGDCKSKRRSIKDIFMHKLPYLVLAGALFFA